MNQPLKERLIEASCTDTWHSDCLSGFTMRTLVSPWHREWTSEGAAVIGAPHVDLAIAGG